MALLLPPAIFAILRLIAGIGGSIGAAKLAPIAGKQIARVLPRLAQNKIAKFAGEGALIAGGLGVGDVAVSSLFGANDIPETADDNALDFGALQQLSAMGNPVASENQQGLSNVFAEQDIRNALESLGVDFEDFIALTNPQGGLV